MANTRTVAWRNTDGDGRGRLYRFSEWHNVYHMANWTYAPTMPLIAGIGLTPLLQWLLVPSLMVVIAHRRWDRQRHV